MGERKSAQLVFLFRVQIVHLLKAISSDYKLNTVSCTQFQPLFTEICHYKTRDQEVLLWFAVLQKKKKKEAQIQISMV